MNYSTFQTVIMERLERDIPDPKHISIQQVTKNNGIVLDGLSIMENDCNISPTLYLNYYYDSYKHGVAFQDVYQSLLRDYQNHRPSTALGEVEPCIKGEYTPGDVRSIFPKEIGDSIEEGVLAFGKKIKGFDRPDAVLSGVESRTSSPVRIVREKDSLEANYKGIYPCGEGAGYAGGITSAAMDGIKVAEAISKKFKKI